MRSLLLISSVLCMIAVFNLPIGYYTFLRIFITVTAVLFLLVELENGLNFWSITFGIIAIIFNPLMPIYLNDKSMWMFIDICCTCLFLYKYLTSKN